VSPHESADPSHLARELARGGRAERILADLPDAVRAVVAPLMQRCGEQLLDLEDERRQLKETLVDLQMALRSYADLKHKLREENEGLRAAASGSGAAQEVVLIGADGGLREVMRLLEKVADTPLPLLVSGETGTGKEVVAHLVHKRSSRAERPFVAINCGALPETLLESELFGIEKGVATGVTERPGKFQQAHGGTLFLDEVGDMTPAMQVKVLRAIQEHTIERVGGRRAIAVDVRIISATNRNLKAEVEAKRFREDLYYRLVSVHVHLPPLRERGAGDIDALIDAFVEQSATKLNRRVRGVTGEARQLLRQYDWPGNVRELAGEIQRAVAVTDGAIIDVGDLTPIHRPSGKTAAATTIDAITGGRILPLREIRRIYERSYVERVLARADGSLPRAANLLGLSYEGLRKKLHALRITPARGPKAGGADNGEPPPRKEAASPS
jgi:transcriptional regulator with PAS, ATPase and Fis domain